MKTDLSPASMHSHADLQQTVQTLNLQVTGAIAALSERNLEQLEENLWQQQVLCSHLQEIFGDPRLGNLSGSDPEQAEILGAAAQLLQANRVYAELIRQAQHTSDVLYQLCVEYARDDPFRSMTSARPTLEA